MPDTRFDPRNKTFDTKLLVAITSDLRDQLKETGNASGYLRNASAARLQRLQDAIDTLREAGWTEEKVRRHVQNVDPTLSLVGERSAEEQALLVIAKELEGPSDHFTL